MFVIITKQKQKHQTYTKDFQRKKEYEMKNEQKKMLEHALQNKIK